MENASKALLMAAGVLLGIIIISFTIYVFRSVADFSNEYEESQEKTRTASYNNKFEKYDREDLTIHDIISAANLSKQIKENDQSVDIKVMLNGTNISKKNEDDMNEFIKSDKEYELNNNGKIKKYRCLNILYLDGRVSEIRFINN